MTSLNSAPFSKSTDSTIYNVFPELNQGKQYLQKQTEVQKKIDKTRKFIESFSPYNKRGQLKKCRAVGQASPNKHVPCACGNAMCTSSTPYCNYQLGACFPTSANQNQAIEDWDVNSNCAGDGRFSSCEAKAGCSNYGYCPPHIDNTLQWQKDRARASDPNGGDLQLNSLVSQQIMRKADYMSNVQDYVLMPPPCNGDLANCPAGGRYYGRNVTIPQQSGVAPYGPGYPHPACGLEVLGNPGDGGNAAVSRTQVESLDATCHAEPDCVGFGKKSGGGWDFLTWNANPTYSGPKDPRMKTPGDYPKYFYIQNPVTGCNSSKCCGIQGTPGNCKTDPYDPACYVPGNAPQVPNTPTPTSAPPPPSIAGGWSNWSTSCPPAPNNIQTRTCTRPPPAYDGPDCSALDGGNAYRSCNAPVKGGWSDWTTGCPPAPGNQQTRSCTKPPPAYGGAPCSGARSRPCFSPSTFSPTKPPSSCPSDPRCPAGQGWQSPGPRYVTAAKCDAGDPKQRNWKWDGSQDIISIDNTGETSIYKGTLCLSSGAADSTSLTDPLFPTLENCWVGSSFRDKQLTNQQYLIQCTRGEDGLYGGCGGGGEYSAAGPTKGTTTNLYKIHAGAGPCLQTLPPGVIDELAHDVPLPADKNANVVFYNCGGDSDHAYRGSKYPSTWASGLPAGGSPWGPCGSAKWRAANPDSGCGSATSSQTTPFPKDMIQQQPSTSKSAQLCLSADETAVGKCVPCSSWSPAPDDPRCSDGKMSNDQTDIDCGGSTCPPCAKGKGCYVDSDCLSGKCQGATCFPPSKAPAYVGCYKLGTCQ